MRSLKFRAWNKTEKWMDEDFWIRADGCPYQEARRRWDMSDRATEPAYDDLILEQYTGLKDKNGKEIYEGDIITHLGRNGGKPHMIFYSLPHAAFCGNYGFAYPLQEGEFYLGQIEVIGNIHENPDLL